MNKEQSKKFEDEYLSWVGTPYFHMAKTKGAGADCALFIAEALRNSGFLNKVDDLYYSTTWMRSNDEIMLNSFEKHLQNYLNDEYGYRKFTARKQDLFKRFLFLKGDILLFRTDNTKVAHHSGIYHQDGNMIHSTNGQGVHEAQMLYLWRERLMYVLRIV